MAMNSTTQPITPLPLEHIAVITKVYIAFLIPSVIGSFSVFLVSLVRWKNLQEQRQLLVQLALADLLASSLLLSVTSTNFSTISSGYRSNYEERLCLYGLPLALVFYILSLLLAITYALKSKTVFQGWRSRPEDCADAGSGGDRDRIFYVLLWLTFASLYLVYVTTIAPNPMSNTMKHIPAYCTSCLLFTPVLSDHCPQYSFWHREPIYFFLLFMAIEVFLVCTVIYHEVSKRYQGQQQHLSGLFPVEGDGQSRKRFKHVKHTARKMVLVILFCWTPALLLFVLTFFYKQDELFSLYIIQAVTVSLQGFLNSLVYAWKRPNFTEAVLGERTPLITYHQTAFFEESLKSSL